MCGESKHQHPATPGPDQGLSLHPCTRQRRDYTQEIFQENTPQQRKRLILIAVDEAHVVEHWGGVSEGVSRTTPSSHPGPNQRARPGVRRELRIKQIQQSGNWSLMDENQRTGPGQQVDDVQEWEGDILRETILSCPGLKFQCPWRKCTRAFDSAGIVAYHVISRHTRNEGPCEWAGCRREEDMDLTQRRTHVLGHVWLGRFPTTREDEEEVRVLFCSGMDRLTWKRSMATSPPSPGSRRCSPCASTFAGTRHRASERPVPEHGDKCTPRSVRRGWSYGPCRLGWMPRRIYMRSPVRR